MSIVVHPQIQIQTQRKSTQSHFDYKHIHMHMVMHMHMCIYKNMLMHESYKHTQRSTNNVVTQVHTNFTKKRCFHTNVTHVYTQRDIQTATQNTQKHRIPPTHKETHHIHNTDTKHIHTSRHTTMCTQRDIQTLTQINKSTHPHTQHTHRVYTYIKTHKYSHEIVTHRNSHNVYITHILFMQAEREREREREIL